MIIKNAKKSEPWEVESHWEWIPSEKRKMQETLEYMEQKILPFEKIYTKELSHSKEKYQQNKDERNLQETLHVEKWNLAQKDRPQSANVGSSTLNKKVLENNFMKNNTNNIFQMQQQQLDYIKPFTNKEKKKIEQELRKREEFRKYQTEQEAKNKNKNLLYFNVRFPHMKVEDLHPYRVPNSWDKTPLIEELPASPIKGRIPDDLLGKQHIEGNKIKQKIVFYKEDRNESVSSIEDNENEINDYKNIQIIEDIPQNKKDQSKQGGTSIFTNQKLKEQRESAKIQQEINKLLAKNNQINPKTGKEAFGVHRKREINSFLDMRKMMKVSNKVDSMIKKLIHSIQYSRQKKKDFQEVDQMNLLMNIWKNLMKLKKSYKIEVQMMIQKQKWLKLNMIKVKDMMKFKQKRIKKLQHKMYKKKKKLKMKMKMKIMIYLVKRMLKKEIKQLQHIVHTLIKQKRLHSQHKKRQRLQMQKYQNQKHLLLNLKKLRQYIQQMNIQFLIQFKISNGYNQQQNNHNQA